MNKFQVLIWAIAPILIWGNQELMLCQKTKGGKMYLRERSLNCSRTKDAVPLDIEVYAPSYAIQTQDATWIGIYKAVCETHYFFWGSYTKNQWKTPIEGTTMDAHKLLSNACPSTENPTALPLHIEPPCVYQWPTSYIKETIYCVYRPTKIHISRNHPLTSDEEIIDNTRVYTTYAYTMSGAIVKWAEPILPHEWSFSLRYKGLGLLQDDILMIEGIQEGFQLKNGSRFTNGTKRWITEEGFVIYTTTHRIRRDTKDLDKALTNEVLGKLNYESAIIETYLERFQIVCHKHNDLQRSLNYLLTENPDAYARAVLNTTLVTSTVIGDYLMVWPCKSISSWGPIPSNGTACTLHTKIWYMENGTNHTGFYQGSDMTIRHSSPRIDCEKDHGHLFIWHNTIYIREKGVFHPLDTSTLTRLTSYNPPSHMAPIWNDLWIYGPDEFAEPDIGYITEREQERREAENKPRQQNEDYNQYMQIPFVGMPLLPSLTRLLEISALIGGGLHFWGLVGRWVVGRLLKATIRGAAPVGSLEEAYQLYKRSHSEAP